MRFLTMIKELIPNSLKRILRLIVSFIHETFYLLQHRKALKRLRKKSDSINVLFFAILPSVWKYDSLYKLMSRDKRFNPVVLVCPQVNMGRELMLENLRNCYNDFERRGYNVIMSYDESSDKFVDAHNLNPDIIFYTNPYKGLIDDRYYIDKFRDVLTCYCNYGYILIGDKWGIDLPFHRAVWRYFTEYNYEIDPKLERNKPIYNNRIPTGYPLYDEFIEHEKMLHLKISPGLKKSRKKVIIWAPHHTINSDEKLIKFSTFLVFADYMQELRKRYSDSVYFVFKPHPLLKTKLYNTEGWGRERTDEYYDCWLNSENSTVIEGDYIDLFLSSDAMIHDCASFSVEYLYTTKPIMFLAGEEHGDQYNIVGQKAYNCHYLYESKNDIINFIENVVLKGIDTKKEARQAFYNNFLLPPNNFSVAENILENIVQSIGI